MEKHHIVKSLYLYIVSLVGLVTFVIGAVSFINIGLSYFVFDLKMPQYSETPEIICSRHDIYNYPALPGKPDGSGSLVQAPTTEQVSECVERNTKSQELQAKNELLRSFAWSIAAILVGLPIWIYHWFIVRRQG